MQRSQSRGNAGFTLIELLVVIAIIAILIGLLVPAVQKVREAAMRVQCMNNMKQLAVACHDYHDANYRFPPAVMIQPGVNATLGSGNFGPNWVVMILPYIEQGNLMNSTIQASISRYMTTPGEAGWRVVGSEILSLMICPFDADGHAFPYAGTVAALPNGAHWAHGNYGCNAGGIHQPDSEPDGYSNIGWLSSMNGQLPEYGSNGAGSAGTNISLSFGVVPNGTSLGGVMCINYGARLTDITDGSSNTVMLNELRTGQFITPTDPRGLWAIGMPGASVTAGNSSWDCTTPNDNNSESDDLDGAQDGQSGGGGTWTPYMGNCQGCNFQQAQARSRHPNLTVTVAFCDGSVRTVGPDIPQNIWWAMLGRGDGLVFDVDSYSY
jgi:prepilin-type N-terminal cleavage/methylation domain-containing protein/prepilin-type processing-associated H-X9-DG protein